MCGICGAHDPEGRIDEGALQRMTDLMAYRGPDKDGFYIHGPVGLGYRRLSIIDLATGDQPIANEDETVWLVFNGELYNYRELRRGLQGLGHRFRTQADTEVLAHGYEAWGTDVLQRLNGMFAFALWDEGHRRLFLARDRLGVKPLYYRQDGARLTFASELKALRLDGTPRLDARAVVDYLSFLNCYGAKTMFRGIQRLLPGEYLLAEDGRTVVREYWDLPDGGARLSDERAAIERYLALLEDSVGLELMSDVPLGAQISGGMDSSAVVVAARKRMDAFDTFSAQFPEKEFDETPYARQVAELVGSRHHEVTVRPSVVPALMPKILFHLDEPRAGPGVIPQFLVNELASKHVRVVLTGHGGDELFAGYPTYYATKLREAVRRGKGDDLVRFAEGLGAGLRSEGAKRVLGLPLVSLISRDLRQYGRAAVFPRPAVDALLRPAVAREARGYDPRTSLDAYLKRSRAKDRLGRIQYLDVKTYLPSLLDNEDRSCMAYSVESRVPILDHRMAEFAASLSPDLRVRGLTLKYLPRRALSGYLPREIVEHKKMGFPVPISAWFRDELTSWASGVLAEDRVAAAGVLDPEATREVLDAHLSGRADLGDQVWALVNLQLWLSQLGHA